MADEAEPRSGRAAVRYLGTVDCHYWPEAEDALVASLRGDRNECVRWEAAMALGSGCCCTKKTIEALTIVTSCSDRDGAPKETSNRVHAAAAAALDHCLACFCNVAAPAATTTPPPPPVEGTKPPTEGVTPPLPVTPAAPVTEASAKPISPGDIKPATGLNPQSTKDAPKRPVGPDYYARIAKAPLAAVLAEARRVAEQRHNQPIVSDTPFAAQGHTVAALMSYASGPDTQNVVPAGMTVWGGEMRAEVVSAKPTNLWDLLNKPEGEPTTSHTEVVIVPAPKPVVTKTETVIVKTEPARKPLLPTTPTRQIVSTPAPLPKATPVSTPAPMVMSKPEPTLDFPPPSMPMPMPTGPAMDSTASVPAPSPYFATMGTGTTVMSQPAEPAAPGVSAYHPTAATPAKQMTVMKTLPASPYNAVAVIPSKPIPAPMAKSVPAPLPVPASMPTVPMSPRPMPAPPAPVVPASMSMAPSAPRSIATPPAPPAPPAPAFMPAATSMSEETVGHLLATARGTGPVEVRKTSIQELVKLKANTPEVMAGLESLSDDPVPSVRAEAVIAAARLRMGR